LLLLFPPIGGPLTTCQSLSLFPPTGRSPTWLNTPVIFFIICCRKLLLSTDFHLPLLASRSRWLTFQPCLYLLQGLSLVGLLSNTLSVCLQDCRLSFVSLQDVTFLCFVSLQDVTFLCWFTFQPHSPIRWPTLCWSFGSGTFANCSPPRWPTLVGLSVSAHLCQRSPLWWPTLAGLPLLHAQTSRPESQPLCYHVRRNVFASSPCLTACYYRSDSNIYS
jgi:hypothetical protein